MRLGIPLSTLASHPHIDVCIDGADAVDANLNLVKGGGGAHLREKMVRLIASLRAPCPYFNPVKCGGVAHLREKMVRRIAGLTAP
jgi:ribose 5-phosphate isomerase